MATLPGVGRRPDPSEREAMQIAVEGARQRALLRAAWARARDERVRLAEQEALQPPLVLARPERRMEEVERWQGYHTPEPEPPADELSLLDELDDPGEYEIAEATPPNDREG